MRDLKKVIIFDMDGVLVDSEPVIEAAAIAGLKEYGVNAVSEDFVPFIGMGEDKYIGCVAEKYGVKFEIPMKTRVYEIYLDMVEENLRIYPGTPILLGKLKSEGWSLALASSADRIKIEANLRVAGIDMDTFSVIISGEDVVHKKPSPDIYLNTAEKLGIDPLNCIAIEDATNGVQAAKKAGMGCIAVTTSFEREDLVNVGADFVCNHIEDAYEVLRNM